MREQLVRSDILEAVITLASGVFYSTGVSACILFLNNKKKATHKGRICLIDGSEIYTPQRAQNEISPENVKTLFKLYSDYDDVMERCKVVTLQEVEKAGFDLTVKRYIDQKKQKVISPVEVRQSYQRTLDSVLSAERRMIELLIEGGYVHEQ